MVFYSKFWSITISMSASHHIRARSWKPTTSTTTTWKSSRRAGGGWTGVWHGREGRRSHEHQIAGVCHWREESAIRSGCFSCFWGISVGFSPVSCTMGQSLHTLGVCCQAPVSFTEYTLPQHEWHSKWDMPACPHTAEAFCFLIPVDWYVNKNAFMQFCTPWRRKGWHSNCTCACVSQGTQWKWKAAIGSSTRKNMQPCLQPAVLPALFIASQTKSWLSLTSKKGRQACVWSHFGHVQSRKIYI